MLRAFEQTYETVGFIAIRLVANDRAYSIRQHFTVLAFLCLSLFAILRHSLWRVSSAIAAQMSCLHYILRALEHLFKGTRIRESRNSKISRYIILSTFWIWAPSSCSIYQRSYRYACTVTISTTCGISFQNTWRQIRMFKPIIAMNTTSAWQRMQINSPTLTIKD